MAAPDGRQVCSHETGEVRPDLADSPLLTSEVIADVVDVTISEAHSPINPPNREAT